MREVAVRIELAGLVFALRFLDHGGRRHVGGGEARGVGCVPPADFVLRGGGRR
jgi:hypothetical protein